MGRFNLVRLEWLDDEYIMSRLRQFEQALDDRTLVRSFKKLRSAKT